MNTVFHTKKDTNRPLRGTIRIENEAFDYELYLLPITGNNASSIEDTIVKRLASRQFKGRPCLGITEDMVRTHIDQNTYSGAGFIWNKRIPNDSASATLQFHNWLTNYPFDPKQLWINDLCREKDPSSSSSTSPVKALFQLFEQITRQYQPHMTHIHLMVDNSFGKEAESNTLQSIYNAYGFHVVPRIETQQLPDAIFMEKRMLPLQQGGKPRRKSFRKSFRKKRRKQTKGKPNNEM